MQKNKKSRRGKTNFKTSNKILETETKTIAKTEPKPVVISKEIVHNDNYEIESECPSTPPRNDMVKEREAIMKQNAGVNWISFVDRVQKEAAAEEELVFNLENKSKQAFKESLENEMHVRELARQAERQEQKRQQDEEQRLYKEWEKEEERKALERHQKVENLKKMRQEQIKLLNEARERYAKKELRRDLRASKKAQEEKKAHERELLEKKKAHYAMMKTVLEENAKHKEIVLEQQRKDAEEDIRLQKLYAKMLEDQERARAERLAATYAAAEQKVANLLDCTAAERRIQREADERAERELLERQAADDERRRLKRERRHKEALEIQDYLSNQIKIKKDALQKEHEEDLEFGKRLAKEAAKSLEEEKLKIKKLQEQKQEVAKYIQQQIRDNEIRRVKDRADMNQNETQMNMSLIRKIESGDLDVKEPAADPMRPFAWRYKCRSKPF